MVALVFNAHGFVFQSGLDILRSSFLEAEEALSSSLERAKDEAFAYQQAQEQGAGWVGERDDDGHIIWDQQTLLDNNVEVAQEANYAVRCAFAVSIYHHWERSALRWLDEKQLAHPTLVSKVRALGYKVDPKMDEIRLLVNALKHGNAHWGLKLFELGNPYFEKGFCPNDKTDWYDAVRLTHDQIEEIFNVVAASGPDANILPGQN